MIIPIIVLNICVCKDVSFSKDVFSNFGQFTVGSVKPSPQFRSGGLRGASGRSLFRTNLRSSSASFKGGAAGSAGDGTSLASPTRTRTSFPETWLWLNTTTK